MSKVLKTAAIVVGVIAIAIGTAGALAPAATASALGSLGITASAAAVAAGAGLAASALSLAATAAAGRPGQTTSGNQTQFTASLDQGVPYAIGRTAVAGYIVHRQTFDWAGSTPSNSFQTFFGVWSGGGPIQGVEAFQVNASTVTFGGDVGHDMAYGGYSGWMWLRDQLGATPEAAALQATGYYPYPAGWSAASKMSGYAAFAWTLKFDAKGNAYPGGSVPQPRAVLNGVKVYDPRLDSTYPGGVGSCRALNESTYVYSQNPFLHGLTWALGRWQNGKRILGIGMAIAAIDMASAVSAANVADANNWKVGGVVYSTDGKWDVLKKILAAGSGEPLQLGGMLSFAVDTPRVSLATITDTDIIGRCTVPGTPKMTDRFNGCIPIYREETQDWQLVPAAKVSVPDYVAADGAPRTKAITWELVQQVAQVGQLASYAICNSREIDGIVIPLKLRWIGYRPGDALTIASSMLGMDSQLVVMRKRHLEPVSGAVTATLRTETTSKHAFALGQTTTPPPAPALQTVDRTQLLTPGISASWSAVSDDDGNRPDNNATVGSTLGVDLKAANGALLDPSAVLNSAFHLSADGSLIATIGGVPTNLGKLTLPDLGAASDAARRQLEADMSSLSAAVAQLTAGQAIVQNVFRDAGLYTDPTGGIAKLFAIENRAQQITALSVSLNAALSTISLKADVNFVNQAILTAQLGGSSADLSSLLVRLTSAEANISGLQASVQLKADATVVTGLQGTVGAVQQSLNALTATVATKASQATVDAQGQRLTLAEQTLSAFDGASIAQAVTASRLVPANADAAGATTILDLLNGTQNAMLAQQGIAQARQELGARVSSAFDAIASLSLTLGVQIGALNASVSSAQAAQISGDQALANSLAQYQASNNQSVATVSQGLAAQVSATEAIAGTVNSLTTAVNGHSTTLTTYGQSIDGLSAKYGVEINANGVVTGFSLNNGSGRTDLVFVVNGFKIAQPDGSLARTVFNITDAGVVQMHDVEVDRLKVNTAVVPVVSTSSTPTSGTSTTTSGNPNAFVNLFQKSITVQSPGLIRIECNLNQSFTAGLSSAPWQVYLTVNGQQLPESVEGGTVPGDSVTSVGFYYAPAAGTYTMTACWGGHTSIVAKGRSFCALALTSTAVPPDTTDGGNYTPMGGGSSGGGTGGGGGGTGGGGFCPAEDEPVLLANDARDGPGVQVNAGDTAPGMWVWTRHEHTGDWGAYPIVAVRRASDSIWRLADYPCASPTHLFDAGSDVIAWQRMDAMPGARFDRHGTVVAITVEHAHTYVVGGRLSHNKLATSQQ